MFRIQVRVMALLIGPLPLFLLGVEESTGPTASVIPFVKFRS